MPIKCSCGVDALEGGAKCGPCLLKSQAVHTVNEFIPETRAKTIGLAVTNAFESANATIYEILTVCHIIIDCIEQQRGIANSHVERFSIPKTPTGNC